MALFLICANIKEIIDVQSCLFVRSVKNERNNRYIAVDKVELVNISSACLYVLLFLICENTINIIDSLCRQY